MRDVLVAFVVFATAAIPLGVCLGTRSACERAYRETRFLVNLKNATPRQLFEILEERTGYPIARDCDCGHLKDILDSRRVTLCLSRELSAMSILKIASGPWALSGQGWVCERGRVVLRCFCHVSSRR